MTAAIPLNRKRLVWHPWLDMPVGLTPQMLTCHILLGEPGLGYVGPYTAGAEPGWLVLLGISNPGWLPVRGTDFSVPLTFTFPGRQIHSAQISPDPAARTANTQPRLPGILLNRHSGNTARAQVTGDFTLRPGHGYTITLLLGGTPAADFPRILQDGSLAGGKIVTGPGDDSTYL